MPALNPGTALAPAAYERLDALIALIQDAVRELEAIEAQLRTGTYRRSYLQARIREASRIIASLLAYRDGVATGAVVDWARDALPPTYQYGAGLAVRDLQAQAVAAVAGDQSIHLRAVGSLIDRFLSDTTQIVVQLQDSLIRTSRVVIEQAAFTQEIAQGILGGMPRRVISRQLERSLQRTVRGVLPEGAEVNLTHVEINDRRYRLDTWSEMYARTELARASTAGTRVLTAVNGVRHVQITSHAHEPCICTPFEGRIYALEPEDPAGYPWIGIVPGGGCPMHPNCVHREAPAVLEFLEERGEVAGRRRIPADFVGISERELARLVRENREQLARYSRVRAGIVPEDFRLRRAAA